MAQLFEKVELASEGELTKIQALLEQALERRLQDAASEELDGEDREELHIASANFMAQLRQFVVFPDEAAPSATAGGSARTAAGRTQMTPAGGFGSVSLALRSPLLPPLSPPPADAEVAALEAEVSAAAARAAELRGSMQAALQEQLAANLAACRPTADLEPAAEQEAEAPAAEVAAAAEPQQHDAATPPEPTANEADARAAAADSEQQAQPMDTEPAVPAEQAVVSSESLQLPLSPQTDELQQRLLAAANRMPTLRARLESATDRLQRVVAAVAADVNRPPPGTVEKAMLGKTPARPSGENVPAVSPLVQQALESGQISTRRRVARDVQPVPFSQPE
ncbi:hypothetical protein C2E20_1186 [Micractinium conductrix]|uniref:Uncharacterized protein n=1 Tax=Micractinium conductrix TaxID=554055 RepID=A0A2P6VN02_9CHLO|nr:hypothetical protein C2E20_1186 [Micractinium conductrix]|eukprot:PSC75460.1 hypothetical protein C2E20_1186 [Micractinium conductrix]